MCGIWGIITKNKENINTSHSSKIKHRGPDETKEVQFTIRDTYVKFVFHRLAIVDISHGSQPFVNKDENRTTYVMCNGEIYNYLDLISEYNLNTTSDCHVILDLYLKIGLEETVKKLDGEFAFVVFDYFHDTDEYKLYMVRDRFGIRPLFYSVGENEIVFSSELKGITPSENKAHHVYPRKIYCWESGQISSAEYYSLDKHTFIYEHDDDKLHEVVRNAFIESVKTRMISERPIGCLLSGGLDSSLVAGIASRILAEKNQRLNTFSIGISDDSPDILYARKVAHYINSIHHEVIIPQEVWLETLTKVVTQIETYDTTTVRASTGQYLLAKWISENTDVKVVLNGDGSDETCSGYMYFFNAPDAQQSHKENIRLLEEIHYYDVLRVDRGISAHGLEARVPFLSHKFVDTYLSIHPKLRNPIRSRDFFRMEKYLLRKSFEGQNFIPDEVLWRKKEAFSDGVSNIKKSWYQMIDEYLQQPISCNTDFIVPLTTESMYYRNIFDSTYNNMHTILETGHYWLPKWSGNVTNPSARILNVYNE